MKNIIVFTTAICRIDIHNRVLPNIIKLLSNLDIDVIFLINIDGVYDNKKYTQEETKENYINYFKDTNIKFDFHISEFPCFFNAVKNLLILSDQYINEDSIIFWLEDDWYLDDQDLDIDKFKNVINRDFTKDLYVQMIKLPENDMENIKYRIKYNTKCFFMFRPCLISYRLFKNLLYNAIMTTTVIADPEEIVKKYSKDNYKKHDHKQIYYSIFTDIGREWQKDNNMKKWERKNVNNPRKQITYL